MGGANLKRCELKRIKGTILFKIMLIEVETVNRRSLFKTVRIEWYKGEDPIQSSVN